MNSRRGPPSTRALLLPAAALVLAGLGYLMLRPPAVGPVSQAIARAVQINKVATIDLSALTPFDWTHLDLFGPYTGRPQICARLELGPDDCRLVAPESVDEGQFLLAFTLAGRPVHAELHDRAHGDFSGSATDRPIPRQESAFRVQARPQGAGLQPRIVLTRP